MLHLIAAVLVALAVQQDPALIAGTVRDSDGLAIAGAVVEARTRDGHVARARTDVEGRFHPFETRMNTLYRLDADRDKPYEQTYSIVAKAS